MFTYADVKWFYGQSECTYYLNYFIMNNNNSSQNLACKQKTKRSKTLYFY